MASDEQSTDLRVKIAEAKRGAAEMDAALRDAILFDAGFLLVRTDGVERIAPERVTIKPERKPDAE